MIDTTEQVPDSTRYSTFFVPGAMKQEWNGRREITEKTFKFNSETVPPIIVMALIFPAFCYTVMKDELVSGLLIGCLTLYDSLVQPDQAMKMR